VLGVKRSRLSLSVNRSYSTASVGQREMMMMRGAESESADESASPVASVANDSNSC